MIEDYQNRKRLIKRLNSGHYDLPVGIIAVFAFICGTIFGITVTQFKQNRTLHYLEHSEIQATYDPWVSKDCRKCHNHKNQMLLYFKNAGTPSPLKVAESITDQPLKRPALVAAIITKGERNTPYWVRNHGYKKRHHGMGGVNPKDWGAVPKDPKGQAKQIDNILDELLSAKATKPALNNYGGDSSGDYAVRVLEELHKIPLPANQKRVKLAKN